MNNYLHHYMATQLMIRPVLKVLAIGLFLLASSFSYAQDTLDDNGPTELLISEAIEQGMLELKISGTDNPRFYYEVLDGNGVHYGKCMAIILKSNIDSVVLLRLDCGTQLMPADTAVQTMIVTKEAVFPLYPNRTYATRFYAMCGQLHDASPNIETTFSIGELADTGLLKLANYLGENYIQNMPGQHAMWAYTDQVGFDELEKYGADSLSIAITKEILNSVDLETKLTPKLVVAQLEETNEISIKRHYFYAGLGLLFILATTIVVLIITRTKNDDQIA